MKQVSQLSLSANFDQEAHYYVIRGSLAVKHSQMTHSLHALSSQRCIQERHVEAGHQVPLKLASETSYYKQGQDKQRGKRALECETNEVHHEKQRICKCHGGKTGTVLSEQTILLGLTILDLFIVSDALDKSPSCNLLGTSHCSLRSDSFADLII
jgi:hypothetical protein